MIPKYVVGGRIGLLKQLHQLNGRRDVPHYVKLRAVYYFGSLEKSMMAAKTEPRLVSGWNKAKITAELKRMAGAKQSFSYGLVRRNYPTLVNATENHFGGWGNALYAAGIDPHLHYVRLKWRGPKLTGTPPGACYPKTL